MGAMTDFFENKLLDFLFRGQALGVGGASAAAGTGPAAVYIGLLTAAPADGTAGTEVAGGAYARVAVASSLANWSGTQGAATTTASSGTSGTTTNNAAITFPAPTAAWGTVTHVGIYDAASGGNLLLYSALGTPKTPNIGDPPAFAVSALSYRIDD